MYCCAVRIVGILALLSVPSAILAQQSRIQGPVDRLRTVRLRGNIHPNANPQFDAGPVDPAMKLDHVMVMLKRSAAQQTALDQLLAEQQDRSSRNYHAWLTPEQFGDRFGLSPNDVAQVVSWLQSEGLAVDEVSRARNWIWFSGTCGADAGSLADPDTPLSGGWGVTLCQRGRTVGACRYRTIGNRYPGIGRFSSQIRAIAACSAVQWERPKLQWVLCSRAQRAITFWCRMILRLFTTSGRFTIPATTARAKGSLSSDGLPWI